MPPGRESRTGGATIPLYAISPNLQNPARSREQASAYSIGVDMAVWLVRAGKNGEDEASCLDASLAIIGFRNVPSLSGSTEWEAIREVVANADTSASQKVVGNFAGQLWAFVAAMQTGDIVALPQKRSGTVALGKVTGPYEYREIDGALRHTRKVEWIRPDVPRTAFGQDLLYSLGAFLTVCQIKRNDAETRIRAILDGQTDPGLAPPVKAPSNVVQVKAEGDEVINLELLASEQIREHLAANFKGHDLTRLVDEILRADGYFTYMSPPGPDGGVDILARKGTLGLEGQKLCVQVKSSDSPCDVTVFRGLQGSMQTFQADRGLLVSWGGFNRVVQSEARMHFYSIRLWDSQDILEAIFRNYDRLSDDLRAELPLKRVWAMVLDD